MSEPADPHHETLIAQAAEWLIGDHDSTPPADDLISSLSSCLRLETMRRVTAEHALHERAKKDAKR